MRLLACGTGLAFAGLLSSPAVPATDDPSQPQPANARALDTVVVTGTRLPLTAIDMYAPVIVLDRDDIERFGANSIGEVLQSLPQNAGVALNTNMNAGADAERFTGGVRGDGSVRVRLRGHSTVVLLNGRRFPNSGPGADASVDLNTLPISWIERVEVLASGASAVYGADAVGGVVNIITRRDAVGLDLKGSRTVTAENDGEIVTGQAAVRSGLGGGLWSLGLDYTKQDAVTLGSRGSSSVPLFIVDRDGTVAYAGNNATANGRFLVPEGNDLGLPPGDYTRVTGATGQTADDYRPHDRLADGYNYAPFNYAQTPNERAGLWLSGHHPLDERVLLLVEGLWHHRESAQVYAPEPFFAGDGLRIPADNYYNPFGVDLVFSPGDWGPLDSASIPVARRFVELGNRGFSEDEDLWRLLVGLEGTIGRWHWTASVARSESDATTVRSGTLLHSRLVPAIGPSGPDATGRIVCGQPDPGSGIVPQAEVVPGCVPVNLFGGAGSVTQEQVNYLSPGPLVQTGTNEERTAELVLNGPWGRMLGREVHWVVGADYRREAGSAVYDPRELEEFGGSSLTRADYDARELFGEAQLPLLHDRPWARDSALSLGVRWSDFSSFGQNTAWQAGMHWRPAEEWTFRANYADVFRIPTLWELGDPVVRFPDYFAGDPCGMEPTPEQQSNCEANGVPGGAYEQSIDDVFTVVAGGNLDLEPESGHSVGAGVVYVPGWAPGLSVSVDFLQLEIDGLIWQAFVEDVLFECAENGTREACADIRRFPDGRVAQVATLTRNFGGQRTRSVDLGIDWTGATRRGDLAATLLVTYLDRWNEQPYTGGGVFGYAGRVGFPRWRAQGNLDWGFGAWTASYGLEYVGSYSQVVEAPVPLSPPFEAYDRRVEPVLYHDLQVGYDFGSGVTLRAGITNLTDEDPPYVNLAAAGNTEVGLYRLLGRTYFLTLGFAFR